MTPEVLRAWWFDRQGLASPDPSLRPAAVLARSGWARSVGGSNPYLTLFARAGTARDAAEAAHRALEIHELPAARGCTYVVPAEDYALALTVGQGSGEASEIAIAQKHLGLPAGELERLEELVLEALRDGPRDPRELRDLLGDAVRSFGPEGKKRGINSSLPLALGRLQSHGRIRRVPVDGRLDHQRFRYARWEPSPLDGCRLAPDEAIVELARRYFQWIGPASLAQFQAFAGTSVRAARAAVAELGLVPVEEGSDLLLFPEDRQALREYAPPDAPRYALVGSIDGFLLHRRELSLLVDEADRSRQVQGERGCASVGGLQDLPSHAILDRGRLIGLWEYDPEAGAIAWCCWGGADDDLRATVARTEQFVRDQLGDARSFSLDSPASRRPRIEALRSG